VLEHRLWRLAGIDLAKARDGSWYRDIASGMGADLDAARAMSAYTIADRGTWLSFGNKDDLTVLVEGDPRLLNRYDVILLNPAKHPAPKQALARRLAEWLLSPEGQAYRHLESNHRHSGSRAVRHAGKRRRHGLADAVFAPVGPDDHRVEIDELAVVLRLLLRPDFLHRLDGFAHPLEARRIDGAVVFHFVLVPAAADAKQEASLARLINRGGD
jgi:hypothetical protein